LNELLISQPDTGEQALEIADQLIRSGGIDVLKLIDSVAAFGPQSPEIEGEIGESSIGVQRARLMSQALRETHRAVSLYKCTLVILQIS